MYGVFNNTLLLSLNRVLTLGGIRPLEISDVDKLEDSESVSIVCKQFEIYWEEEMLVDVEKRSLWRALRRTFGLREQLFGIFLSGITAGCACGM